MKMKLHLIVLFVFTLDVNGAKLHAKKSSKTHPQSAIIAIQIIDPHENRTSLKNSKRTIESSLGYGYPGTFGGKQPPPRYEVYKYSQHDIPPYTQPPSHRASQDNYNHQPPIPQPDISNFYQPGTVLFSTINQRGKLGELSPQFPVPLTNNQFPIPVIILRVHPNQLSNPAYPNLPDNHFLASAINSIDINSLLSNHVVKQQPQQYQQTQSYVQQEVEPRDEGPVSYQAQQYYPQYQYQEVQQEQVDQDQGYGQQVEPVPSKYHYESTSYQQSGPLNDFNTPELLTHENYPSEKHTQVIFKRSKKAKLGSGSKKSQSPLHTESSRLPVASHLIQKEPEHNPEANANYDGAPMYYTVQYSDDQQYVYKQEPQYNQGVQNVYSKAPETQYIYVSQPQPEKH